MPYANYQDDIKWRENNRDYHKTPEQRTKQKQRRINKRKEILKNLPDKYEYDYSKDKKSKMKYTWKKKGLRLIELQRTWDKYGSLS